MGEEPTGDSGTTEEERREDLSAQEDDLAAELGDASVDGGPDPATDEAIQNEADGADIPEGDGGPADEPDHSDTSEVVTGGRAIGDPDWDDNPNEDRMKMDGSPDGDLAPTLDDPTAETPESRTHHILVGRVQPANRRADGAGFATHLHISVESIADGRMLDVFDNQQPIIDREESIAMPVKVHVDADEIAITITSVRETDDMECLELARHQRIRVADIRRGPIAMPQFHDSLAVTIPPPTTIHIDDLCGLEGESLIAADDPVSAEPIRPIYRVGDPVATPHGVGRISDFKEGDLVLVNLPSSEKGAVDGMRDKEFAADDIRPYHIQGG